LDGEAQIESNSDPFPRINDSIRGRKRMTTVDDLIRRGWSRVFRSIWRNYGAGVEWLEGQIGNDKWYTPAYRRYHYVRQISP